MNKAGKAWLTPCMETLWRRCAGHGSITVHSMFASVANLWFALPDTGEKRLFSLVCPGVPRLPDSGQAPEALLHALQPGMRGAASQTDAGYRLIINGETIDFQNQTDWDGRFAEAFEMRCGRVQKTAEALRYVKTGFSLLPEKTRLRAEGALLTGDAPSFLGLGSGLTPSFDDACVGVMACCAAFGYPVPFRLSDYSATTDISARYLALAWEGYFGEPLWRLMHAWGGKGSLQTALDGMLQVGATSGTDMLYGAVTMALSQMEGNKEKDHESSQDPE